jgi:hypothetical protein
MILDFLTTSTPADVAATGFETVEQEIFKSRRARIKIRLGHSWSHWESVSCATVARMSQAQEVGRSHSPRPDAKSLCHAYLREFPRAPEFLQGHLLRDQFCRAGLDLLALRGILGLPRGR